MKPYPKILIFGQPFDNVTGGGITLSSLFNGWPKDKIAVAATGHFLYYVTQDVCDTYYQLGVLEQKWIFPFNLFQRSYPSGIKKFEKGTPIVNSRHKASFRHLFVNAFFYPALNWLGVYHLSSKMSLSASFKKWLGEYSPDIVYIQVSDLNTIHFACELIDYLKKPVAIHMMDDWPETISARGPLKRYWKRKIDKEFKKLLDKIDVHLSISDAMSEIYQKRYGKEFLGYHNPVDVSRFIQKEDGYKFESPVIKILYVGRIGNANINSIQKFAAAISNYKYKGYSVHFDIYTPDADSREVRKIKVNNYTTIYRPVAHEEIPRLLIKYNVLLLPLDFNKLGQKYARYSIPTKASEYMVSGVPIIIFAPGESAISQLIHKNKCGYYITENSKSGIFKSLDFLIENEGFRKEIAGNAATFARERFESNYVRKSFQNLLITLRKR
jgi:glycosyltransferase involved in cell wall biosynthesis